MALDLRRNFIRAQYLETYLTYFHQILYMHSYWQDLAWDCYTSFFGNLYLSNGPMWKFCFRSISWEPIGRISPNFIYAFIVARSSLWLLHIIFAHLYQSYGPWFTPKFHFRSISWEQMDKISPNFYICNHIDKIYVGIVTHHFSHICTRVMTLDLRQNLVSVQYLENKWTEFHQILHMHSYWQDLGWDCYTSFFAHLYHSYGPWFKPKFRFGSISWEQMDRITPNFIYAFILTRSSLGLLHIIFCTFVPQLWPLI